MGNPARPRGSKAICVTRNPHFSHDGAELECRIVLDYDKLKNDGYRSYPFDEVGTVTKDTKNMNFIKSNFPSIKQGKRNIQHGLDLPKIGTGLEVEFEERIYKNINNIGKYIISIEFSNESSSLRLSGLDKYLEEYPHIKIKLFDKKYKSQTKDITKDITSDIIDKEKSLNP